MKNNYTLNPKPYTLVVGWLYPELMSTYGDRGNIMVLQKRCEWRGIEVEILPIDQSTNDQRLKTIDLLFGGGAQDREQDIVMKDLKGKKAESIIKLIENNIPALFVCGAPQLMGKYYEPAEGQRIEGVGVFDMISKHPGGKAKRLIGNTVAEVNWENLTNNPHPTPLPHGEGTIPSPLGEGQDEGLTHLTTNDQRSRQTRLRPTTIIVGFENHGGRTYLGKNAKPFAKVIKGFGNNAEDGDEGVVYKNAIGCYFHGPLLPKNPEIADFLIKTALEVKYKTDITLAALDDSLETQARNVMLKKMGVEV